MAKALSEDLRVRVVSAVDEGLSGRAAAERFGVGVSSAIRWVAQHRQTGSIGPGKPGGNQRSHRIDAHKALVEGLLAEQSDVTLAEIADYLGQTVGYRPAVSVVCRFCQRHDITLKKSRRTPASKTART